MISMTADNVRFVYNIDDKKITYSCSDINEVFSDDHADAVLANVEITQENGDTAAFNLMDTFLVYVDNQGNEHMQIGSDITTVGMLMKHDDSLNIDRVLLVEA